MPVVLVSPMNETPRVAAHPAPRLATLNGKAVGMLDISKPGGSIFLDHLERLLKERYGVARVVRDMKPTFAKPAPAEVLERLLGSECDTVIEALAD